jgi:hypothetical protein
MNTLKTTIVLLGLITIAGANVAVAGPKKQQAAASDCYTDDGYGRKRPCSAGAAGFKRAQKTSSSECWTDDGYGRKRSCSQGFKRR